MRENWTIYQAANNSELNPFIEDRFGFTVLSHTDLSRERGRVGDINLETINWGNYDLVVIDESHNFRNNLKGKRDETGEIIRKSRYERLMDDIINSGVKTKVLLLSATPVNNDLKDLRNQLYLLTGGNDAAFTHSIGIGSVKDVLATAQRTFNDWANDKTKGEKTSADLLDCLSSAFFKLLDETTIARSRKHIQRYYADTIARVGQFPRRLSPVSVFPEIDAKGMFMSYDRLNDEILNYKLSVFNPSSYVLPGYKSLYEEKTRVGNFTQKDRERFLIGMMKVNFLKRLESSVHSFAITMQRTIDKTEQLEEKITVYQKARGETREFDFDLTRDVEAEAEELQQALETGSKLVYRLEHLDTDRWLKDLQSDKQQIGLIWASAKDVDATRDSKLAELRKIINEKVKNPSLDKFGNPNRKILLFTAYADTARYLYENLRDWVQSELKVHAALVTGGENQTTLGSTDFNHILTNFSPVSKKRSVIKTMPQTEQIDLLIATDCISEGQNLQDCDIVINFDIHWKPVRLIQRFGRIDRIGSINETVRLVNFWATKDLDKYINLKTRVEARMALVDVSATGQDDILNAQQIERLAETETHYRDKQLLRLKDEILDLEDFNETVALNEFTLDDFRADLLNYLESNRRELENTPLGIYGVAPVPPDSPHILPSVIFCLRQTGETAGNETINPLQPHFLIYVRDDGTVRFNFTQSKQVLEVFRRTSAGHAGAHEELCRLFDEETEDRAR